MEKNNNFCIVSSMEEISSVNLDAYTYLVQRGEMSSLKIWYNLSVREWREAPVAGELWKGGSHGI